MEKIVRIFLKNPVLSLAGSFIGLIAAGVFLLILPWASRGDLSFLDALFTATSAVTVTGLVVKSTGADFTFFGQTVILLLIQIGAIGIMTGAGFFFLMLKKSVGLAYQANISRSFEQEYLGEALSLIKFIAASALLIEAIGAVALFLLWQGEFGLANAVFPAVFHAVSAFGNAGFSLFDTSLEGYRTDIPVNLVFMLLIIAGGLGFLVLREIWLQGKRILRRDRYKFSLHTKIVLAGSFAFIILGAALFYFFENGNPAFSSSGELFLASFFQSVTARTAGFNTVPVLSVSTPTALLLMMLMFIGGAPGSAAGGIKITTAILAFLGVRALFSGKQDITAFRRTIPADIIRRALASALVLLFVAVIFGIALLYIERGPFSALLFEAFSAFGTVGLSTGLTPHLSAGGKVLIILLMFVGRLAPLTLAIIGGKKLIQARVRYPEERVQLG